MKAKMMTVMIGALERGSTILTRKRKCPAPSMRAASHNSSGIWAKNWRSRKIEKALAIKGIVRAGQLLIQGIGPTRPNQVTVRKLGTQTTASGIMKVANNSANRNPLPGNSIRAKA